MKQFLFALPFCACALVPLVAHAQNQNVPAVIALTEAVTAKAEVQLERPKLTWAPPNLENPTVIEISNENRALKLDPTRDYLLKMPATPVELGINITGGRNVVLIGGEIRIPSLEERPDTETNKRILYDYRGMYLNGQTGTIHVEGLLIRGPGLKEGFNFDQRLGATVQLQNIRVETVHGTRAGHHADVFQTWAGPAELRIDRMTGYTTYQGNFLMPNQHFKGPRPRLFDFRNLNLVADERSGYMMWFPTAAEFPSLMTNVWVLPSERLRGDRDNFLWPKPSTGDTTWRDVKVGIPAEGDFVPEGVAGLNYISPGYQWENPTPK